MWVFVLIGALLGLGIDEGGGLLIGAACGWLLARQKAQGRELGELREQLVLLRQQLQASRPPGPEAATDAVSSVAPQASTGVVSEPAPQPGTGAVPSLAEFIATSEPEKIVAQPAGPKPEAAHVAAPAGKRPPLTLPPRQPKPANAGEPATPGFDPFTAARNWLFGGNSVVRVGIVILFMGVAFLLKFAAEHATLPVEARFIGVALGAVAGLVIGWRLRQSRAAYALALQGAAVAVLYLTVFAAFRLYPLLPAGLAFGLLLVMVGLSALLALLQDSRALAVIASAGGFMAPLLTSTGHGSHVALFSYYLLLNAGIVAIARYKAWRALNVVGFLFTFGISAGWGVLQYRPELYATTQPFLLAFFLIYVLVALLFAQLRHGQRPDYVDATLVFGTPIIGFGLQMRLVHEWEFGAAFSALALAGFYLTLATWLARRDDGKALLREAFTALGAIFATLAIPLALSAQWTAGAWALEAAGVVWIGLRQQKRLARAFGYLLLLLAGLSAAFGLDLNASGWVNGTALGCLLVALGSVCVAILLHQHRQDLHASETALPPVALYWGLLWWLAGAYYDFGAMLPHAAMPAAGVLWLCLTAVLLRLGAGRWQWPQLAQPTAAWSGALAWHGLLALSVQTQPFSHGGWLAWPLALLTHGWLLRRNQADQPRAVLGFNHVTGVWVFALLGVWLAAWSFGELADLPSSWPLLGWALVPAALLGLLPHAALQGRWPWRDWQHQYVWLAAAPVALALYLWSFAANWFSDGSANPLPYLPLLNPLDLAQALVWLMLWQWSRNPLLQPELAGFITPRQQWAALGIGGFFWLNAMLLRSFHHWGGVPFQFEAMWNSLLVQAGLSLFWSLLALAAMLLATRRGWRGLWLTGAGLLAAVVAKLMLFDLSGANGVERIVSFIGVGLLMLVIGYLAPVPPKQETTES